MATYRIFRMKEHVRQHFRWAPHTSGVMNARPRDFEPSGEIEASSAYAAWKILRETDRPLEIGDLVEAEDSTLLIYKYVGMEEAKWILPEVKPVPVQEELAQGVHAG
jgi:hypothetical protein